MTNHKISAIDLYICVDTLNQSMRFTNWGGSITEEARKQVMEKLQDIMYDMEVEVLTEPPNPEGITADCGV